MKQSNIITKSRSNLILRKQKIRKRLEGTTENPRVSLFRSNSQIYAQVIDDEKKITVVAVSSLEKSQKGSTLNVAKAKELGKLLGERTISKGIKTVVFDRNGRRFHGRVKSFADGLREAGLTF